MLTIQLHTESSVRMRAALPTHLLYVSVRCSGATPPPTLHSLLSETLLPSWRNKSSHSNQCQPQVLHFSSENCTCDIPRVAGITSCFWRTKGVAKYNDYRKFGRTETWTIEIYYHILKCEEKVRDVSGCVIILCYVTNISLKYSRGIYGGILRTCF